MGVLQLKVETFENFSDLDFLDCGHLLLNYTGFCMTSSVKVTV